MDARQVGDRTRGFGHVLRDDAAFRGGHSHSAHDARRWA